MLQIQVYDAATKTRSLIQWPAPGAEHDPKVA